MTETRQVFVSGRVQGVGYRDWVVRQARQRQVTGWVRNRRDGRVEMLVSGEDEAVGALIDACREGPPLARVEQVEAHAAALDGAKGFTKRFTA